jgi:3-phenylpropionate/cinnamic acid dioxygenase small subunit
MPAPSPALTLQDMLDRAAISDVLLNYATGVDRRDWALYRSVFTETIAVDFAGWDVQPAIAADDWVASVRGTLACFDATHHSITNHVITLHGNRAEAVAHMVARHMFEGEMQTLGGFYAHHLVRQDDGWKIVVCRLVTTWDQGDRGLFDRARARGPRARIDVGESGM